MIFAIDFDGCLVKHAFPKIGEPIPGAFETLKKIKEQGHQLILWTCREDCQQGNFLSQAIEYCKLNGIEFDAVNENVPNCGMYTKTRKIYADYYIDDRAVLSDWPIINVLFCEGKLS